LQSTLKIVY